VTALAERAGPRARASWARPDLCRTEILFRARWHHHLLYMLHLLLLLLQLLPLLLLLLKIQVSILVHSLLSSSSIYSLFVVLSSNKEKRKRCRLAIVVDDFTFVPVRQGVEKRPCRVRCGACLFCLLARPAPVASHKVKDDTTTNTSNPQSPPPPPPPLSTSPLLSLSLPLLGRPPIAPSGCSGLPTLRPLIPPFALCQAVSLSLLCLVACRRPSPSLA
jgi:hypothetical protein